MLATIHKCGTGTSILSAQQTDGIEIEIPGVLRGFVSWKEAQKLLKARNGANGGKPDGQMDLPMAPQNPQSPM